MKEKNTKRSEVSLDALLESEEHGAVTKQLSFEQAHSLLDELVAKVESGGMPLDVVLRAYERGAALLEHLRGLLAGAEEKVRLLQKGGKVTN